MTHTPTSLYDPIYARDLDGTGSMHACSMEDPGAVEYVPATALADALEREAKLRAALQDFVDAKFEVISGRHPFDASGQSDVDDMTDLGFVLAVQSDARAALTPPDRAGNKGDEA